MTDISIGDIFLILVTILLVFSLLPLSKRDSESAESRRLRAKIHSIDRKLNLILRELKIEIDEFDVVLVDFGDKKLNVVKVVKNLTNASLMDAKKMVESTPVTVVEGALLQEANQMKAELEEAGAAIELKPSGSSKGIV